mgnify:CR=1 FL=1
MRRGRAEDRRRRGRGWRRLQLCTATRSAGSRTARLFCPSGSRPACPATLPAPLRVLSWELVGVQEGASARSPLRLLPSARLDDFDDSCTTSGQRETAGMRPLSPSPLSPSSSTASSSDRYPSTTAPRRVCKSLAVHAEAHEGGMRATVYCRVSSPKPESLTS